MVEDAKLYQAEDDAQQARVDAKNGLEGYVFNLRNTLNDDSLASKLDFQDKEAIRNAVENFPAC